VQDSKIQMIECLMNDKNNELILKDQQTSNLCKELETIKKEMKLIQVKHSNAEDKIIV